MVKIAFIGNSLNPAQALQLFIKMTPGKTGRWGKIIGVNNYKEADYYAVIDSLTMDHGVITKDWISTLKPNGEEILENLIKNNIVKNVSNVHVLLNYGLLEKKNLVENISGENFKFIWGNLTTADHPVIIDVNKCIFLGAHPESLRAYRDMSSFTCFKKFDCIETFGFGEWWLNYDYDYLSTLSAPQKTKKLGSILSNAETYYNHKARLAWMRRFTDTNPSEFDLYGRVIPFTDNMRKYYRGQLGSYNPDTGVGDHMTGKETVLKEHKYMLEFDNDSKGGYFSERIFDTLLSWAMPIYWGGENLHKFIPTESFRYLDINGNGEDVYKIMEEDPYEKSFNAIAEARNILLNKLQIWPRIHEAIFGTPK